MMTSLAQPCLAEPVVNKVEYLADMTNDREWSKKYVIIATKGLMVNIKAE